MGSLNRVTLIGHLGRDAELRFTAGGTPVATVSLATSERFTDRDGNKKEATEWHRITIWGKTAEALHEYLLKGKQICVEGKIQSHKWTNKEGQEVKTTEIRADRIVLLGGGGGSAEQSESGGGGRRRRERADDQDSGADPYISDGEAPAGPSDDDIPF